MLKLRISPGLGVSLKDHSPQSQIELANSAQQRLARSPAWLYEQRERRYVVYLLSNEELTSLMQKPDPLVEPDVDWDYEIVKFRRTTAEDRYAMLAGRQVDEVTVFPATHEPTKNTVVDRAFVVVLNYHDYERMPQHDRYLVSAVWKRAHRGREYEMIKLGAYTIYQLTAICTDASTSSDAAELDAILRDYGIGRVSIDPYELKWLRKILDYEGRVP